MSRAIKIGAEPPMKKIDRQLKPSCAPTDTSPARAPPNGMAAMISVTTLMR